MKIPGTEVELHVFRVLHGFFVLFGRKSIAHPKGIRLPLKSPFPCRLFQQLSPSTNWMFNMWHKCRMLEARNNREGRRLQVQCESLPRWSRSFMRVRVVDSWRRSSLRETEHIDGFPYLSAVVGVDIMEIPVWSTKVLQCSAGIICALRFEGG